MQASDVVPIPDGRARLVSRNEVEKIPAWVNSFARQAKDHRYYEILEDTLRDPFEHHYLVLENENGEARAIQPLFFLRQNLTEGVTGQVRAALDAVRRKFPRFLTMRVMMVGCAAGDGQLDDSLADREWIVAGLRASLEIIARNHKASLVILKDFPSEYRPVMDKLSLAGYTRVPSMPLTKLRLDYADFESYLSSLGSATRKNMRRKHRKTLEAVPPVEREIATDPTPYMQEMYPLYLQVHDRSPMKFETLTTEYFQALATRMPERTKFFFWRQQGKLIAFSFCLVHDGTMYDECLGLDYGVALELHLYYYTIREILTWAIEQGLKFYCSTPLNYDPKLHLGCNLAPLDLYVRHTASLLNPVFGRMVKLLEPTRHDPVLRHFPNAHELRS
jgi:predicted N-acyltransferase